MKRSYCIMLSLALSACGSPGKKGIGKLDVLKNKKDSLRSLQSTIGEQLVEIEKEIAKSDTQVIGKSTPVSTLVLKSQPFEHYFEVQGLVATDKSITMNAEIGGSVKDITVKEGQHVIAGQVLISLDTDMIRSSIMEVEVQFNLAEKVFERQKNLWAQKMGSEVQFLQAETNKNSLQQSLRTLNEQMEKAIIRAPFSGSIEEIFPKKGELAIPGLPLVRMVNASESYIVADVSEKYAMQVKSGNKCLISFPLISEEWYTGKVWKVGQYINPDNRTFKVNINLDNNVQLKPNMLSVVQIRDFQTDSAIVVPSSALMQDSHDNNFIFQFGDDKRAIKRMVQVGLRFRGSTHIISGLNEGTELVIQGARSIKDGDRLIRLN